MLSSSVASSSSAAAALDLVRLSALTFSSSCSIPSCQTLYGPGRRDLDQVGVRRDTFIFWPSWAPTSVDSREMAKVGLYYTGDADEVRCHECSVSIKDWKEGDDPRTVHLSKSPMCPFLNRHIATESRVSSTNTTTVTKQSLDVDRRSVFDSESWDDEDDTDGVNRTRYSISDSLSSDAMDVFKPQTQSHSLRNHKCDVAPKTQTAKYSDDYFNPDNPRMQKESVKMCSNNETKKHCLTASSTKLIDKKSLKAENERLRNSMTCRQCRKEKVQTLFLPCRHLVSCEECAEKMIDCIQCKDRILGTVRTYFA